MGPRDRFTFSGRDAAVLAVGTELLLGLIHDTNTGEVASALARSGMRVRSLRTVGDDVEGIAAQIGDLIHSHAAVVVTGGLGPTHDDVTREAAAEALGVRLVEDPSVRRRLESVSRMHATERARAQMLSQALVLDGATVLAARTGTAPGQVIPTPNGILALLPGPPGEMRPMLSDVADLLPESSPEPIVRIVCAGLTESDAQIRASDALRGFPSVALTVLAQMGTVAIVLRGRTDTTDEFGAATAAVEEALSPWCMGSGDDALPDLVIDMARRRGLTLATAESCTGGLLAAALTSAPGSSAVFKGGVVAYADRVKTDVLGVSGDRIQESGAVSQETVEEMAVGALGTLAADRALAVTGIAGPGGATPGKPVGTVWFGLASPDRVVSAKRRFTADRQGVRQRAVAHALGMLLSDLREE